MLIWAALRPGAGWHSESPDDCCSLSSSAVGLCRAFRWEQGWESMKGGWEAEALTHRGREAAERVVLPAEHHGACWELLGTAARDVLS